MKELDDFLSNWGEDSQEVKDLFLALYDTAKNIPNVHMEYNGRPGISHSLRVGLAGDPSRPFFAMVDIIDDDPEERWISMCMYADVAVDPDEKGDLIPKGLNDQDAVCFDVDESDETTAAYLAKVLKDAAEKSKK